jgi:hypothetical protein
MHDVVTTNASGLADERARMYPDIDPARKVPEGLFLADASWMDDLHHAIASAHLSVAHPGG